MRILLEAHHPAHVHFWKYPVRELRDRGHEVLMIGRDRDVMRRLLEVYDWIPCEIPERRKGGNRFPLEEMLRRQRVVAGAIRRFKPDVVASLMGSYTQSSKLYGVRNVIFTDSEFQRFNHRIAHPFADEVHTPECLGVDFNRKHRRYSGFHELSYLGAGRFDVKGSKLPADFGAGPGEYVVMRLCAWDTFHDIGNSGLGPEGLRRVIESVEKRWRVYIQPEGGRLPPELERYRLSILPESYHDVLCHARFIVTEGFTTASEALCMGVPSIVINALSCDTLAYQNRNYALLQHFTEPEPAVEAVLRLAERPPSLEECRAVGARYSEDHSDVTSYVVEQLVGA